MSKYGSSGTKTVPAAALLLVGLALATGFSACTEATRPPESEEEAVLRPGVNVYLTLDNDAATPSSHVMVTGKVRAVGVALTPTGFLVDLSFDPAKLQPVQAPKLDDGVLRAINLAAAPGLVKAAGAAPNGLSGDVLFEIEMEVVANGYIEGLAVEVHELTVVEKNFMDVALDVVTPARPLVAGS